MKITISPTHAHDIIWPIIWEMIDRSNPAKKSLHRPNRWDGKLYIRGATLAYRSLWKCSDLDAKRLLIGYLLSTLDRPNPYQTADKVIERLRKRRRQAKTVIPMQSAA